MPKISTRTLSLADLNESPHNWDAAGSDITLDKDRIGGINKGTADQDGYTVIAMVKIPSYEAWAFGHPYGMGSGVVYVRLDSSAGQISGKARIKMWNPDFTRGMSVHEHHTDVQDNTNPTDRFNNPTHLLETVKKDRLEIAWFPPNGHVVLMFKPDTDDSVIDVSDTDNKVILPISVMPVDSTKEY